MGKGKGLAGRGPRPAVTGRGPRPPAAAAVVQALVRRLQQRKRATQAYSFRGGRRRRVPGLVDRLPAAHVLLHTNRTVVVPAGNEEAFAVLPRGVLVGTDEAGNGEGQWVEKVFAVAGDGWFQTLRHPFPSVWPRRFRWADVSCDHTTPGGGQRTGLMYHAGMLELGPSGDDEPQRLAELWAHLGACRLTEECTVLQAEPCDWATLEEVHTREHIQRVATGAYHCPPDMCVTAATPDCARLAVGCVVALTVAVVRGELRNGFALVRPPGHHAWRDHARGFCFFNNVALAARAALREPGCQRVLIVDWDVHHGDGTQDVFYDCPDVLVVSVHRDSYFPLTANRHLGAVERVGGLRDYAYAAKAAGAGAAPPPSDSPLARSHPARGRNINVPVPRCCTDDDYCTIFEELVLPVAEQFAPDVVLVSCGFDALAGDPSGGVATRHGSGHTRLTPAGFGRLTQLLRGLAGGRLVLALEGGYDPESVAQAGAECLRALLGKPLLGQPEYVPGAGPPLDRAILRVKEVHREFWTFP